MSQNQRKKIPQSGSKSKSTVCFQTGPREILHSAGFFESFVLKSFDSVQRCRHRRRRYDFYFFINIYFCTFSSHHFSPKKCEVSSAMQLWGCREASVRVLCIICIVCRVKWYVFIILSTSKIFVRDLLQMMHAHKKIADTYVSFNIHFSRYVCDENLKFVFQNRANKIVNTKFKI